MFSVTFSAKIEISRVRATCLTRVLSVLEGWVLVFFDWFILSMRMQVILDSSFRPPGFSPYKWWVEKESSGTGLGELIILIFI